jgi:Spy/CpxP family protein refolding chaperone
VARQSQPPARRPPTRSELQRAIAVNALTKPVTVAVGAGVAVAAIVLGAVWLLVIAVVVYAALATMTFFDEHEAERVGDRAYGRAHGGVTKLGMDPATLAPEIRAQLDAARAEQAGIVKTITESDLSFADVREEVAQLVTALEGAAGRAQRLYAYLVTQDRAALRARLEELERSGDQVTVAALKAQGAELGRLDAMLRAAYGEMEQVNASLRTVHARLVGLAVSSQASGEAELVGDVRELRDRVDHLTEGLQAPT